MVSIFQNRYQFGSNSNSIRGSYYAIDCSWLDKYMLYDTKWNWMPHLCHTTLISHGVTGKYILLFYVFRYFCYYPCLTDADLYGKCSVSLKLMVDNASAWVLVIDIGQQSFAWSTDNIANSINDSPQTQNMVIIASNGILIWFTNTYLTRASVTSRKSFMLKLLVRFVYPNLFMVKSAGVVHLVNRWIMSFCLTLGLSYTILCCKLCQDTGKISWW